jgi:hypothetical protein
MSLFERTWSAVESNASPRLLMVTTRILSNGMPTPENQLVIANKGDNDVADSSSGCLTRISTHSRNMP